MKKIEFINDSAPYLSAENLNLLQDNVEESIDEINKVIVSPTEPTTGEKVWIQKGKNLWGNIKREIVSNDVTTNINDSKFTMTGTAGWAAWCFESKGRPFIYLEAGTYVFSIKNFSGSFSNPISLNITHSSGTIVDVVVNSSSIKTYYKEFILTEDTPIYLDFYINSNNTVFSNVSFDIQVEKGTVPSDFERYIPKKIHTKNDNGVYEEFYNEKPNDIGWVKLNDIVKYRKIGNIVTVVADSRGTQTLIKDDYTSVGILPDNVKPSIQLEFPWTRIGEGDVGLTMIGTDGNIRLFSTSGTGYWGFTTTYLVD